MRIFGSNVDGLVAGRFWTDKSRIDDNRQDLDFLEVVGPSTFLCGLDLPEFMEDG